MTSSVEQLVNREYKYGFVTDIEQDTVPPGLSEDVIRLISAKKEEPAWLLDWRLKAYHRWLEMTEPHHWPNISYEPVDYQAISYYSAPKSTKPLGSLGQLEDLALRLGWVCRAVNGHVPGDDGPTRTRLKMFLDGKP